MDGKKERKARKPNFSVAECNLLLQLADENLETIREKFSNNLTNKKKKAIWESISEKVNALGVAKRTPTEVHEKWRACVGWHGKNSKPPPPPNATSQRILELFGDEPGFSGIQGGIESGQAG